LAIKKLEDPLFEEASNFQKLEKADQESFLQRIENDQIGSKYAITPHGFCLGCMLTCHESHEVNELYSKLDFRCDCGNSKTPESCQLTNEKEYSNAKNKYNRNYYDLYCHCNLPHDQETIDQYMIQCFVCEDWYHNTHLNPTETSNDIDEKYLLICRTCIKTKESKFKEVLM
jgi:hypothetical protein